MIKKIVITALTFVMMSFSIAYADDAKTGLEYWRTLADLLPYQNKTLGELRNDFDGYTDFFRGTVYYVTDDEAAVAICDYNSFENEENQIIYAITLRETAKDLYRIGDITIGENRSDALDLLSADGYYEVSSDESDVEGEEGYFVCTYVNIDEVPVYEITYDLQKNIVLVTVKGITDSDRALYERANRK